MAHNTGHITTDEWESATPWSAVVAGHYLSPGVAWRPAAKADRFTGTELWLMPDTDDTDKPGAETDEYAAYLVGDRTPSWWPAGRAHVTKLEAWAGIRGMSVDEAYDRLGIQTDPRDWDWFWRHPRLAPIRDAADAALLSRWLVLGTVIVWVNCHISPMAHVGNGVTSRITTMDTFVLLVGHSGDGKGQAMDLVKDMVTMANPYSPYAPVETETGSPEGMVELLQLESDEDEGDDADEGAPPAPVVTPAGSAKQRLMRMQRVLFRADEATRFLAERRGAQSTQLGYLLNMFSGEGLGRNLKGGNRIEINTREYRAGLLIGAQPATAGEFLESTGTGFTQRFLFMPSKARDVDLEPYLNADALPDTVPTINVPAHALDMIGEIPVCAEALTEARRITFGARTRDYADVDDDDLVGQYVALRFKVAVALSVVLGKGRLEVDAETWRMAGSILTASSYTRAKVMHLEAHKRRRRAVDERVAQLEADDAAKHERTSAELNKRRAQILRYLKNEHDKGTTSFTDKGLTQGVRSNKRAEALTGRAVQSLIDDGSIAEMAEANGTVRYALGVEVAG